MTVPEETTVTDVTIPPIHHTLAHRSTVLETVVSFAVARSDFRGRLVLRKAHRLIHGETGFSLQWSIQYIQMTYNRLPLTCGK